MDATPDAFARVAYSNRSTANEITDKGVSAQIDVDLGFADMTSITAYRTWDNRRGQDADFSALDILYRPVGEYTDEFNTFSQELRFSGERDRLNWLVGGFYAREEYHGVSPLLFGRDYYAYFAGRVLGNAPGLIGILPTNSLQPGAGQRDTFDQENTTYALFTNDTFNITDQWDVTVGLRYTVDEKNLTSQFTTTGDTCTRARAAFLPLAGAAGVATATAVVGGLCLPGRRRLRCVQRGPVQHRARMVGHGEDQLPHYPRRAHLCVLRAGYKAGGFNFDRPNAALFPTATGLGLSVTRSTLFRPETVDAYEVGLKTQFFDRSVTLNAAYFYQDYKDFQLNTFLGTNFIVESIPQVTSQGVDVDFAWRPPVDGLRIVGGVTYAQTEYGQFTAAQLTDPSRFGGLFRLRVSAFPSPRSGPPRPPSPMSGRLGPV